MIRWKKLGQIYNFEPINEFLLSHASNPMAVHLEGDVFRVFFSGRCKSNKSSVGYVDLDLHSQNIIGACTEESFRVSDEFNGFFSHGVSIGNMYSVGAHEYVLFMAWQIRGNNHWRGDIGRLELDKDKKKLSLVGEGAFLGVHEIDPISLSYPWVMYEDGYYKMWYGSTIDWSSVNGEMIHVINYATSIDGETWSRHGLAVPFEIGVAQAFSRPTVLRDESGYHMWFSYRSGTGQKYRIGYASSLDGLKWERHSDSGIDVSETGWDSDMVCYPFVFEHKSKVYMLYNGNDFGRHGFGLAVLEKTCD